MLVFKTFCFLPNRTAHCQLLEVSNASAPQAHKYWRTIGQIQPRLRHVMQHPNPFWKRPRHPHSQDHFRSHCTSSYDSSNTRREERRNTYRSGNCKPSKSCSGPQHSAMSVCASGTSRSTSSRHTLPAADIWLAGKGDSWRGNAGMHFGWENLRTPGVNTTGQTTPHPKCGVLVFRGHTPHTPDTPDTPTPHHTTPHHTTPHHTTPSL